MDNPLALKALDSYSIIYDTIETIPVRWNKKSRRFEVVSSHKKLIPWYCTLIVEFCTGVICYYILNRRILSKEYHVPWATALTLGFVGFMDAFSCIAGWIVFIARKPGVYAWDNLRIIERLLDSETKIPKKRRKLGLKLTGTLDYARIVIILGVIMSPLCLLFSALFIILLTLDPYYYFMKEFFSTFLINHWFLAGTIRYLLTLVGLHVFVRMTMLLVLVANAGLGVLYKKSAQDYLKGKISMGLFLKVYETLRVLSAIFERFINPLASLALIMTQTLGISGIFSTIAMRPPIIQVPMYLVCPSFAFAAFGFFHVFITPLCNSYEQLQHLLKEMKRKQLEISSGRARKIVDRQIIALKIISVDAGFLDFRFFPLRTSTKITMLYMVAALTIDALLSPLGETSKLISTRS